MGVTTTYLLLVNGSPLSSAHTVFPTPACTPTREEEEEGGRGWREDEGGGGRYDTDPDKSEIARETSSGPLARNISYVCIGY